MVGTRSMTIPIIVALGASVLITGGWTASEAWHLFAGHRVVAVIDSCNRTVRGTLWCTGHWIHGGHGHIDGVRNENAHSVTVRASGDSATVDDGAGIALVVIAAATLALTLCVFVRYLWVAREFNKRDLRLHAKA